MRKMRSRLAFASAILAMMGLVAPNAAASAPATPNTTDDRRQSRLTVERAGTDRAEQELVAPIIGWLVVVAVRGGAQAIKVGVRARTARAAREAAKQQMQAAGYVVQEFRSTIKGDYRTAGGFQIRVNQDPQLSNGYNTFNIFKNRWGAAGKNREWHHIVEQRAVNQNGDAFPGWTLHNRQNLINVRNGLHQKCINSVMATKLRNLIKRDREALRIRVVRANREQTLRFAQRRYSYNNQHLFGLRLQKHCGVRISGSGI